MYLYNTINNNLIFEVKFIYDMILTPVTLGLMLDEGKKTVIYIIFIWKYFLFSYVFVYNVFKV